MMAQTEWIQSFAMKTCSVLRDPWGLEFDENIEPKLPNQGWKEYIRKTCAWFSCTMCKRSWPSNRVMVVFHMQLTYGRGIVKVRAFCQNCKKCTSAPMEKPSITPENLDILMEKLVEKIRIKCYNENLGKNRRYFPSYDVKSPHEPAHCEGCKKGICTQNTSTFKTNFY